MEEFIDTDGVLVQKRVANQIIEYYNKMIPEHAGRFLLSNQCGLGDLDWQLIRTEVMRADLMSQVLLHGPTAELTRK